MRIEAEGAYADRVLASPLVSGLDARDRMFVRETVLGLLRWKGRLDRIIDSFARGNPADIDREVYTIIRLGLYQILFMGSVPEWAAVNESVELARKRRGKGAGGLANAMLRRFLRDGEPAYPDDPAERYAVEYAHPLWLVRRWIGKYGEETAVRLLEAGVSRHAVSLRTTRDVKPEDAAAALAARGYQTVPVDDMPGYLLAPKAEGIFDTPEFRDGMVTAQDPAAGLPSLLLAPDPGERILDLCAAPGGKTTHIAGLMDDNGGVLAVDVNPARLGLVSDAAARLHLASVETAAGDARTFDPGEAFDRVLADVPCSGTAVLAKRPGIKWRLRESDIVELAALQGEILGHAAELVRPGGVLVYSTCTLEAEENEETAARFLAAHPEFREERDDRFRMFAIDTGYRILPHLMQGSGAYAVKLRKTADGR